MGSLEVTDNALTGTDIDELDARTASAGASGNDFGTGPLSAHGNELRRFRTDPADQVAEAEWERNRVESDAPDGDDTNSGGTVTSISSGNGLEG